MARPRAASYGDQRAQILRSAAELFAQRGYTATTMNEVAAACGVSKPTLYHYFSDKGALLGEIVGDHVARLQALAAEGSTAGAAEPRLRDLIRRFMRAYASAQSEHRVLTEDVKFLDAQAGQVVLEAQRDLVQVFSDAIGDCRPDLDPQMHKPLAMLLFGMINWTFTWLRRQGPLTHEALADIVADLFFGGLPAVKGHSDPPCADASGARGQRTD